MFTDNNKEIFALAEVGMAISLESFDSILEPQGPSCVLNTVARLCVSEKLRIPRLGQATLICPLNDDPIELTSLNERSGVTVLPDQYLPVSGDHSGDPSGDQNRAT